MEQREGARRSSGETMSYTEGRVIGEDFRLGSRRGLFKECETTREPVLHPGTKKRTTKYRCVLYTKTWIDNAS